MDQEKRNLLDELFARKFFNLTEETQQKNNTLLNTQVLYNNPFLLFPFGRILAKSILYNPDIIGKGVAMIGVPEAGTVFTIAAIMSSPELVHNFSFHILRNKIKNSPPFKNCLLMADNKDLHGREPILVDDFLAHGFSKIQALRACYNQGVQVSKIFTLFDFGYGGKDRLAKSDYPVQVNSIFDLTGVAWYLHTKGSISITEYEETKAFIRKEIESVRAEELKVQKNHKGLDGSIINV